MSYSLAPVRAATKAAVLLALAAAFDEKVLVAQPVHAHDRDAHLANAERQLALLPEPGEGDEVEVSMNGWIGSRGDGSERIYTGCGFGCSASIVRAKAPA